MARESDTVTVRPGARRNENVLAQVILDVLAQRLRDADIVARDAQPGLVLGGYHHARSLRPAGGRRRPCGASGGNRRMRARCQRGDEGTCEGEHGGAEAMRKATDAEIVAKIAQDIGNLEDGDILSSSANRRARSKILRWTSFPEMSLIILKCSSSTAGYRCVPVLLSNRNTSSAFTFWNPARRLVEIFSYPPGTTKTCWARRQ